MRRGFTLLEVLVASMLLSMLVTILTMIFQASSAAWTTGTAAVAGLGTVRQNIAIYEDEADNTIFGGENGRTAFKVTSVWGSGQNILSTESRTLSSSYLRQRPDYSAAVDPQASGTALTPSISGANSSGRTAYIVGVTSYGPDGRPETWDDITTLPEED